MRLIWLAAAMLITASCGQEPQQQTTTPAPATTQTNETAMAAAQTCENRSETRIPLFGDLHVHTSFSFDAAANSTGATPADAHRYARGESIGLPARVAIDAFQQREGLRVVIQQTDIADRFGTQRGVRFLGDDLAQTLGAVRDR